MQKLYFKNYFENKTDYFSLGLGVEAGMDWEDIVKVFEKDQWVSAKLPSIGGSFYKLGKWEIVPGTLTPYGADIRIKKGFEPSFLKGGVLNRSGNDKEVYHLDRDKLILFLTKGWSPEENSQPNMDTTGSAGMPSLI